MKVILRTWKGNKFEESEPQTIGAYDGLAFRTLPVGEPPPATAVVFPNLRVTEVYLSAKEDALVLYCEEVETTAVQEESRGVSSCLKSEIREYLKTLQSGDYTEVEAFIEWLTLNVKEEVKS